MINKELLTVVRFILIFLVPVPFILYIISQYIVQPLPISIEAKRSVYTNGVWNCNKIDLPLTNNKLVINSGKFYLHDLTLPLAVGLPEELFSRSWCFNDKSTIENSFVPIITISGSTITSDSGCVLADMSHRTLNEKLIEIPFKFMHCTAQNSNLIKNGIKLDGKINIEIKLVSNHYFLAFCFSIIAIYTFWWGFVQLFLLAYKAVFYKSKLAETKAGIGSDQSKV